MPEDFGAWIEVTVAPGLPVLILIDGGPPEYSDARSDH